MSFCRPQSRLVPAVNPYAKVTIAAGLARVTRNMSSLTRLTMLFGHVVSGECKHRILRAVEGLDSCESGDHVDRGRVYC